MCLTAPVNAKADSIVLLWLKSALPVGNSGVATMWSRWRSRWISAAVLLVASGAPPAILAADSYGIRVEAGFRHDDNVTRARSDDRLSDRSYSIDLNKSFLLPVSEHTRLALTGFLGGEKFVSYTGLSHVYYGINGEFQYRTSGEFGAPTFGIFARASGDQYESSLRDGSRYSFGASVRKPVTDRIELFSALTRNVRHAKSSVFDNNDHAVRVNVDYALFRDSTLYFGGEYRRGDIVSTARPAFNKLDEIATAVVVDDVFTDTVRESYRVRATSVLGTVGFNLPFGERHALDISWRWVQSTTSLNATRYFDNQVAVSYLGRF